jgi:hypothetical protein
MYRSRGQSVSPAMVQTCRWNHIISTHFSFAPLILVDFQTTYRVEEGDEQVVVVG